MDLANKLTGLWKKNEIAVPLPAFPEVSVGDPVQCGVVTVFPLYHQVASRAG